jgi:hypothetical protein
VWKVVCLVVLSAEQLVEYLAVNLVVLRVVWWVEKMVVKLVAG